MTQTPTAIRRMLRPIRAVATGAKISETRAWRQSLPRISENALGLVAAVTEVSEGTTDLGSILGNWDTSAVIWRVEGGHAPGVAILDAPALAALVDIQLLRRNRPAPAEARDSTDADAALASHVVTKWLAARDATIGEEEVRFRIGQPLDSARSAKVLLPEGAYHTRRIGLSFADGMSEGTLTLAVPVPPEVEEESGTDGDRGGLLLPETEMTAVLHRTRVPFRWVTDLEPGMMLDIPRAALTDIRVESAEGRSLARARLGQIRGHRALRIEGGPDAPGEGDAPEMTPLPLS